MPFAVDAHTINVVHHVVETIMNTLSVIFNTLLLYLIAYHSSFGTPIYQILLAIDATLDLTFSIIVLLSQTVVITGGGYVIYMNNGFIAGWSYRLDTFLIFMWLLVLHLNVMWIPVQFIYRYTFLCLRDKPKKARKINAITALCTLAWVGVGLTMTYVYSHAYEGFQEQGRHVLALNAWEVPAYVITVGSNLSHWKLQYFMSMWAITCASAIAIVAVVEGKIKKYFASIGNASHQTTRKLHKEFHRALLAMAVTPLLTTTGPIIYYIIAILIELSPGPMQCFIAVACTSITMFNPLTTIFFMRCYRETVLRPVCTKKSQVDPNQTRATGLSVATSSFAPTPSVSAST